MRNYSGNSRLIIVINPLLSTTTIRDLQLLSTTTIRDLQLLSTATIRDLQLLYTAMIRDYSWLLHQDGFSNEVCYTSYRVVGGRGT